MSTSRRDFLLTGAAFAAGAAAGGKTAEAQTETAAKVVPAGNDNSGAITERTLAEAEKVMAVSYQPEHRSQMLHTIGGHIKSVEKRRQTAIDYDDQPASGFDPRLPETVMPEDTGFHPSGRPVPPLPASGEDIAFAPVTHLSAWLRAGKISSLDLTRLYLSRLKEYGPVLEAVITLTEELALSQAAKADAELAAGNWRGPLHGVPWVAKDLFDTKGIRTTWGARPFVNRVPDRDARVVELLAAAGAPLMAKTTLGALARGDVWFDGKTRNPWNIGEGSSGSSAGSAASVAAGLAGFALGTETLGSIISPAMRCGCTGLRPTFGRVPRFGAMALSYSMDKIGALCRTAEDTALVLGVINGFDGRDRGSVDVPFSFDGRRGTKGLRVGYSPEWFAGDGVTEVDRAGLAAARRLGFEMVELSLPDLPYNSMRSILSAEAGAAFEDITLSGEIETMVEQGDRNRPNNFRQSHFISAVDFIQAERLRSRVMRLMHQKFDGLDAMLSPSGEGPMIIITNFTGHPSLTFRTGFLKRATRDVGGGDDASRAPGPKMTDPVFDVPHAMTLWGPLFGEDKLITIAMALEAELAVWDRRPPVGAG